MAYYWPQYGVAIEVDDDPYLLPFDEEAFPDTAVYHVTTDVICDPESFSALAHHIARIHDIELPHDFDELIYSRRLMLHMLFGADPSTFARVYTTKDAAWVRRSRPASQDWGVARNSSLSVWLSSAPLSP